MKNYRKWQLVFAVVCLVYIGWMIKVGTPEFHRLSNQYKHLVVQLDSERIRAVALAELAAECRRELALPLQNQEKCSSWPTPVIEAKKRQIEERLLQAKQRAIMKRVLFYTIFVVFFLLTPPFLIYLLIVVFIMIFRNIKIVR
ncbi:MAG: hypothetical protein KKB30_11235 [Proteobacteria bacterium]|nr:hypothetical protein [Pseudomonadota bacterium]MBU1714340.1 hypothetical protein [Pseudomonadota bacterium]